MGRRQQTVLDVVEENDEDLLVVAPSTFLPGRTPHRFRPDPRTTPEWRRVRKSVLARDRFTCRTCGRPAVDVDHLVELVDGGSAYGPENLQALCAPCHDAKSSTSRYHRVAR
ncbi:MAG TPA: HNH endonuclease signature motif containing protein, partial [Thermoplasmata archaeon]|nr:HNH endonuclease signature motif containing protein [Thermoplasmata archaeon]